MKQDKPKTILGGRYQLLHVTGKGGMAVVWRAVARDPDGDHLVAIKRMLYDITRDASTVALFIEEARVGSQLSHPNIVQVLDFGTDDHGSYYLVLEWVEGLDMLEYMRSFHQAGVHVPWQAAAAIGLQALRGLAAAHERLDLNGKLKPVIHRDLSPSNILVGIDGVVKLADFGLARAMDRMTMTMPNIIKGKLAYTAPEVAQGLKATPRSDLFSLGVTLWECLAARRMFPGESNVDVFRAMQAWKIPDLQKLRPDVPPELVTAIGHCIAREPSKRYSAAREVAAALAAVMRSVRPPVDARRLGASVVSARERLETLDQDIAVMIEDSSKEAIEVAVDIPVVFASSPSVTRVGSRKDMDATSPGFGIDEEMPTIPKFRRASSPKTAVPKSRSTKAPRSR
ncbi:MAG: serine/threonine protein kinase [Deltaproteobacteria bacterium]|nr:serine/threonine protein kinase [Deltaproteobacteria bacterium]